MEMATRTNPGSQRGIALVTALLILLLLLSMSVGFVLLVTTEQRSNGMDLDRSKAFYAAYGAMEQINAGVGNLFGQFYAPTTAQLNGLVSSPPLIPIPNINFIDPFTGGAGSGLQISFPRDPIFGQPLATPGVITQGQYQGFNGLITPYTITISAQTPGGTEVRLRRDLQTVEIPVFQFGIFSQTDLSFFPGPNFSFGGRVHTNGNLFLAGGAVLTLSDKTTAFRDVIRTDLSNGWPTATGYTGTVSQTTAPGTGNYRNLGMAEGSLVGTLGSAANPNWTTISISSYNSNLRNGLTGAKNLTLPLVNYGARGIDLIKLPLVPNEDTANPAVFNQRYYAYPGGANYAMLRILLADTSQELTSANLPNLSPSPPGVPVPLSCPTWPAGGPACTAGLIAGPALLAGVVGEPSPVAPTLLNALPPWGSSSGLNTEYDWFNVGYPRIGGYIKIEYQDSTTAGWTDVTKEVLSLGTTGRNLTNGVVGAQTAPVVQIPPVASAAVCGEPFPNAVIRIQRFIDLPSTLTPCGYTPALPGAANATKWSNKVVDYIPNMLYDARQGLLRDAAPGNGQPYLNGAIQYIELDINNLARWFSGAIGTPGLRPPAGVTGYLVYFSDRRSNQPCTPVASCVPGIVSSKLGDLGFEDFVNPATGIVPNGAMDTGEDLHGMNSNPQAPMPLETYGNKPSYFPYSAIAPYGPTSASGAGVLTGVAPPGGGIIPSAATRMQTQVLMPEARVNPAIFFTRALKLVHGSTINIGNCGAVPCGLTITAENSVYIQGDYNAPGGSFAGANAPASVLADAVTLLSNSWTDVSSYNFPYTPGSRPGTTSWYRLAIVAGKGLSFPHVAGTNDDFGTDGGVHNFLRFLEGWGGTLNYRGSIVSFYYNMQAVGTYKCCATVYGPPTRGYNFDTNFLTPALLPPRTPTFRDINTLGFTQLILPTQH
jgi:hypothetical protein